MYYDATAAGTVRDTLIAAARQIQQQFTSVVAIDCGCGAGRDIEYLRSLGFTVHGFDMEEQAIQRCQARFSQDNEVHLACSSFTDYPYPEAQLVLASASLFFCSEQDFPSVWQKIQQSLVPGGIFVGAFLGERDTTASEDYDREIYWPDVMTVNEAQLRTWLIEFDIQHWQEHELDGKTEQGEDHHWHIFEITAVKR